MNNKYKKLKRGVKYEPEKDYCSCSPDSFASWRWRECCFWHDRAYRNELVDRPSRFKADWMFFKCMMSRVPFYLYFIPIIYFLAVRFFGRYKIQWE